MNKFHILDKLSKQLITISLVPWFGQMAELKNKNLLSVLNTNGVNF